MSLPDDLSVRALVLAPTGRDAEVAGGILREGGFEPETVPDIASLSEAVREGAGMAVVANEALITSDLKPLKAALDEQESWSDFPIVVLTRGGGGPERNPVAARLAKILGNVTFLERPFHPTTLISVTESALRGRRRQYQARASLADLRDISQRKQRLVELDDLIRDINDPSDVSFAAAELLGRTLGISRAGYGTVNTRTETIAMDRDWNAPGIPSLTGILNFRDYGSYIVDLKRGETVVVSDVRADKRTAVNAQALIDINAAAFVNIPITERGGFVALLSLNNDQPRVWQEEELTFIREVAQRTRVVIARRQAERDLQDLAASLERQVEDRTAERDRVWRYSRDLLAVIGADGIFRAANPAWFTILGYEASQITGHNFLEFIWPDDADTTLKALASAASNINLNSFENRYRHRDGTERWISWNTTLEGDLVYAYGRDITEAKQKNEALAQAEEQLRQAQKMEAVGQLTGGLAHDFNNLLAAISGSLEMLEVRISQGRASDYERYLTAAKSSSKRAASLTHRLLAFSRRQTLDPKPIGINRLVGGMEDLIRRTVGPQITLEFVGAAGLWMTFADAGQLENALLNLCINARDAMPDGGRLTIETGNRWIDARTARDQDLASGQYVSLCVSDSGTGMTPEVIARAFDPFYTTKPIGEGTGLGLSMVYGFAKQSGGQVRIYSEIGKGTMVCIYLPRHRGEGEAEDVAAELEIKPLSTGLGEKVLVVDDEAIVRMLIVDVLQEQGYDALEAHDGPSALKLLESGVKLDLLITDVGLPGGMNGRQVADMARSRQPGLKVLFVTGYAENAVVGNGHLEPGMHVLTKPFPIDELGRRIKEILASS
ncbi:MAG: two-component system sensor histidine kinase/response regulator [Mucilaginibacter sp.]|nr:two-component system sensor histidine kinase/response regulator [Mucilaginibacter sp.]